MMTRRVFTRALGAMAALAAWPVKVKVAVPSDGVLRYKGIPLECKERLNDEAFRLSTCTRALPRNLLDIPGDATCEHLITEPGRYTLSPGEYSVRGDRPFVAYGCDDAHVDLAGTTIFGPENQACIIDLRSSNNSSLSNMTTMPESMRGLWSTPPVGPKPIFTGFRP